MELKSKLPAVGTTIFTRMSQLAQQHGALNLSQGFPDFPVDPRLLEALNQQVLSGRNQYAPMAGVLELRRQISALVQRCYGREVCADNEVTVTSGATEALFVAIQAVVHAGRGRLALPDRIPRDYAHTRGNRLREITLGLGSGRRPSPRS